MLEKLIDGVLGVLSSLLAAFIFVKCSRRLEARSWPWGWYLTVVLMILSLYAIGAMYFGHIHDANALLVASKSNPIRPNESTGKAQSPAITTPSPKLGSSANAQRFQKTESGEAQITQPPSSTAAVVGWGVHIAGEEDRQSTELRGAILDALHTKGYLIRNDCSSVVSSPEDLVGSSDKIMQQLTTINPVCDGAILAFIRNTFTTDTALHDLVTDQLSIDVRVLSRRTSSEVSSFELTARGGGFSQDTAKSQAYHRVAAPLKQQLTLALAPGEKE